MKRVLPALAIAAGGVVAAAEIDGFYQKPAVVDCPTDAVQSDGVFTGDAPLYKTGAGTLSIYKDAILDFGRRIFRVTGGGIRLLDGGTAPTVAEPVFLRRDAALWVSVKPKDAAYESPLTLNGTSVDTWFDVRETDTAAPKFWRAQAGYTHTTDAPELTTIETVKDDGSSVPAVYFGGYGSKRWMKWLKTDGSLQTDCNVRHIFAVNRVDKRTGVIFGATSANCADNYFHPSNYSSPNAWGGYSIYRSPTLGFQLRRNGESVEVTDVPNRYRLELLDLSVPLNLKYGGNGGINFNGFFTERASLGDRNGGDYLSEAVVFTNVLSQAEIAAVEKYLIAKWGIKSPNGPEISCSTAATRVETLSGDRNVTLISAENLKLEGSGTAARPAHKDVIAARTLDFDAGVTVDSRRADPLKLVAGATVNATREQTGRMLTRTAGVAGTFEKTGPGTIAAAEVAADVAALKVSAGRLALNPADETAGTDDYEDLPMEVELRDPGFETAPTGLSTPYALKTGANQTIVCGAWTLVCPAGASGETWICWTKTASCGSNFFPKDKAPEGEAVIGLKKGSYAKQDVTLPSAGFYAITFAVTGRRDADWSGKVKAELISKATNESYVFGSGRSVYHTSWDYLRFETEIPAAGEYELRLTGAAIDNDGTESVDDVHLVKVPLRRGEKRYLIPNGGFESVTWKNSDIKTGSAACDVGNVATGWEFVQSAAAGVSWANVALVTRRCACPYSVAQTSGNDNPFFQGRRSPEGGAVQLAFSNTNGTGIARTTFTPPAGRWYLKGNLTPLFSGYQASLDASLAAEVTIGETTTQLGKPTMSGYAPKFYTWPTPFEADGTTPVTLALKFTGTTKAGLTADDFELTSVGDEIVDELVTDGSFEEPGVANATRCWLKHWTLRKGDGTEVQPAGSGEFGAFKYSDWPSAYGAGQWGGYYVLFMCAGYTIEQEVAFPAPGIYRLRFNIHERVDHAGLSGWGEKQMRASIGGGELLDVKVPTGSTNFVEHVFDFAVTNACTKLLRFDSDATTDWQTNQALDGVSIRKVGELSEEPATVLPETAAVEVASGAKLYLGFAGENAVGSVRLGGHNRVGVISAATDPGFIEGPGALYVQPKGTMILFR